MKNLVLLATVILLVVISINIHLVMLKIIIHFRKKIPRLTTRHFVGDVLIVILAHSLEILLFALGLYALDSSGHYGRLVTTSSEGFFGEFVYFSAITYTTLGFGDITPIGPLRLLAAVEAITGLILSAWTASVIFVGVLRYSTQND